MNNLNYVLVEGTVTRHPQSKSVSTTTAVVCNFVIAVNRYYKKKGVEGFVTDASYLLIETWGELAEMAGSMLEKGSKVRVVGRLKQSRWHENGEMDKPRERTYILAEHIEVGNYRKAEEPAVLKQTESQVEEPGEINKQLDQDVATTVIPEEQKEDTNNGEGIEDPSQPSGLSEIEENQDKSPIF